MNRIQPYFLLVLALLIVGGCSTTLQTSITPQDHDPDHGISIELSPQSSEYDISDVNKGAVGFIATVRNMTTEQITFAHPSMCFPADYRFGDTLSLQDRHGRSEILLTINKPDGKTVTLRDGPFFFDPGNIDHFNIQPGASQDFHIGWFFQNARGRWEDDRFAASVFANKGLYKVQLIYRNVFPRTYLYNRDTRTGHFADVWTGELWSNKVTLLVK